MDDIILFYWTILGTRKTNTPSPERWVYENLQSYVLTHRDVDIHQGLHGRLSVLPGEAAGLTGQEDTHHE